MTTETWFPISGFEGLYEISSRNRVRSLRHHGRVIYGVGRGRYDLVDAQGERHRMWIGDMRTAEGLFGDAHDSNVF